jgi:putative Holliday junction resolvase
VIDPGVRCLEQGRAGALRAQTTERGEQTMRILGIDYGSKRIGLAVSDPSGTIASPLGVRHRISAGQDAEYLREIVRGHQIARIVLGIPVHTRGGETSKEQEVRRFGAWLAAELGLDVEFWDERFTTAQAETYLKAAGVARRGRRKRRDMLAAQIMLQSYLDAKRRQLRAKTGTEASRRRASGDSTVDAGSLEGSLGSGVG